MAVNALSTAHEYITKRINDRFYRGLMLTAGVGMLSAGYSLLTADYFLLETGYWLLDSFPEHWVNRQAIFFRKLFLDLKFFNSPFLSQCFSC